MLKQLLIFVLCCSWVTLLAQEPLRFTTKQGLPTNHVYDIAEDSNGFMWFATKQGVVKYDGETFRTFTTQNGLPNNDTWRFDTDFNGRVYYFSKSAFQGYIGNDSIYKFSTKDNEVLVPGSVYKNKNNFWFYGNGIKFFGSNEINDEGLDIVQYNRKSEELLEKYNIEDKRLSGVLINPETKEIVYFNLDNNELYFYDWDFNFIKRLKFEGPKMTHSTNYSHSGTIYDQLAYYTFEKEVLFIDFKNYSTRCLRFEDIFEDEEKPMYFKLKSLPNEIQIAIPGQLAILDYDLNVKQTFEFSKEFGQHSYKDNSGNVWLNSISNGVSLLPNTQLQAEYYFQNLKVQKINYLDSTFYVGINNKGISTLDLKTNQEKDVLQFNVPHSEIYHIKKDKISQINIIVSAQFSFEIENNTIKKVKPNNIIEKLLDNEITYGGKDYFSFNGNNYIISSSGVTKCGFNNNFSEIVLTKQGLLGSEIYNNKAYIYGSDGLLQFKDEKLIPLNNELLNISINTLFSNNDFLFVGTDGRGLYIYDEKNIHHLKSTDGLSIQRILKEADTLWLATQKGIKKILLNPKDLSQSQIIDAYYESDGLLQNNTNDIYKDGNNLYAATDIGLAKLNLNNPIYKQQPNIYFKTQNDTLSFKNGERDNIAIDFALHDYVNQEHVNYQYRLLPTQKQWTSTKTKTLNFNNLDPKMHTLEVMATDQHGNTSITKQYLEIVPAWWQTWYNKIGFALIGVLVFLLFVNNLRKRIRKKEQAKAQQEKRVAGLELQALRSQMNPHFVHNSLNAIQYFIQRNEVELSENYLSKFSQLIRLFFEYSRRQNITIEEELVLLKNYLEIEQLRFEEKLHYKIEVDESIDQEEQLIPSMLLQPIVENAVNHGVFHKPNGGSVNIQFIYIDNSTYKVLVVDDGIGINKSKNIFKASSKNYQSNSSKVLHERLDLLNKSKEWKIEYKIEDRSEINTELTGTLVSLTFKKLH